MPLGKLLLEVKFDEFTKTTFVSELDDKSNPAYWYFYYDPRYCGASREAYACEMASRYRRSAAQKATKKSSVVSTNSIEEPTPLTFQAAKEKAVKKKKKYNSFSKRLTRRIVLALTLALALLNWLFFIFTTTATESMIETTFQSMMDTENEAIEKVLYGVEVATHNSIDEIEVRLDTPDEVMTALADELKLNPHIKGFFVAFEADYYQGKGRWFEPYAVWNSQQIEQMQVGSEQHDYLKSEWYKEALQADSGYWSKPYFDRDGAKEMLCTYALPVHDKSGRKVGVFGADVSLGWMHRQLRKMDYKTNEEKIGTYPDSAIVTTDPKGAFSFIITRDGNYLSHPDTSRILSRNFYDEIRPFNNPADSIEQHMTAGNYGFGHTRVNDRNVYVYYAPLNHTGWTMGFVVPTKFIKVPALIFAVLLAIVMLLGLLAVYVVCRITIRRSTRPLHALAVSADEVAKGNFSSPLPEPRYNDEILQLRDSFGNMQQSLTRYIEELKTTTAQKASIESELNIARDIQMAMLPSDFKQQNSNISIHASLTPAKAVGGDLYDYFVSGNLLYFCIGDVSGKSVPAALLMTVTRSLFRSCSSGEEEPNAIVRKMNSIMSENNESSMFVTLFLGVLNMQTGHLRYCSAGHEPPLVIGSDVSPLPSIPVLPVGMMEDTDYEMQETDIQPSTTLLLYTDGLNEAMNSEKKQLGRQRVVEVAQKSAAEGRIAPQEIIERMLHTVADFVGEAEQSDDLTLLAINYAGTSLDVKEETPAITLTSSMEEMARMKEFVLNTAQQANMDEHNTKRMRLAVEEAVANIINHSDATEIILTSDVGQHTSDITITDNGLPFDPTSAPDIDTDQPGEERQIGGLGIFYMRQMSESLEYQRIDGKNILKMVFKTKN